jgi:cell division septation protein DedD
MPDTVQFADNPETPERRLHPRKQLLFPWIQLGVDNGGIVLNISESGLAMQAVKSLVDGELRAMRFQLPESQTWIETRGRIAWIGASKHTAGVEFVGLPEEARYRIRQWTPLTLHPSGSAKEKSLGEQVEAAKDVLPTREPESAVFVPESATTAQIDKHQSQPSIAEDPTGVLPGTAETQDAETVSRYVRITGYPGTTTEETAPVEEIAPPVKPASADLELASIASVPEPETAAEVVENPVQDLVATDSAGVPPIASETRDVETVSQYSRATSAMPAAAENTGRDAPPPLYLYEKTTSPRKSRQWIGVLVLVLLVSTCFFLGIHFRNAKNNQQSREVPATASQAALPSNDSVIPKNPPLSANPKQPVDRPGFVLQVGAMTHKDNADALAESLRKRNFPAFVSHRGTDRFYRVVVGPYSDADSTFTVKEELRKQNFDAIRLSWNP